jgi:hypothetical protein
MMIVLTFLITIIVFASAQALSNAPVVENNPRLVTFQAILQDSKPIQGTITGVSAENGTGVDFNINFHEFPDPSIGPYGMLYLRLTPADDPCSLQTPSNTRAAYHIHVNRVPEDGNCTAAGGHLDPYNVTDLYVCTDNPPETCQVGDLSGKHHKIDTTILETASFMIHYPDFFLSTVEDTTAFFGNRSIVVHDANGKRVNCGNFVSQSGDMSSGNGSPNGSYTSSGPITTATSTGLGSAAMPTQSAQSIGAEVAKVKRWAITGVFGLAVVAMARAAF